MMQSDTEMLESPRNQQGSSSIEGTPNRKRPPAPKVVIIVSIVLADSATCWITDNTGWSIQPCDYLIGAIADGDRTFGLNRACRTALSQIVRPRGSC